MTPNQILDHYAHRLGIELSTLDMLEIAYEALKTARRLVFDAKNGESRETELFEKFPFLQEKIDVLPNQDLMFAAPVSVWAHIVHAIITELKGK